MSATSSPGSTAMKSSTKGSAIQPSATYSRAASALGACAKNRHCSMPAAAPAHTRESRRVACASPQRRVGVGVGGKGELMGG